MVDLDEMKSKWAEYDRKLEKAIQLNRKLLGTAQLNRAQSEMQRMRMSLVVQALIWLAITVALGNFTYSHISDLGFALSGIFVDSYVIAMLAATVGQIAAIAKIDYSKPVAAIQRQLETLRVRRIKTVQWGLVGGTIVWAPALLVVSKALFGVEGFNPAWLWANVAFGLSLIPLTIWLSKKFAGRMRQFPFAQRLLNDIAGRNLEAARAFLVAVAQFEEEQGR